jgi:endonuclease/exonuclease/phosphatase family metal-dependent hydrolase
VGASRGGYPSTVRLATFNLMHGGSPADGTVDPDRLRAAVGDLGVDVLAMQEVDRDQPRSGGADLAAVAARALDAAAVHRFAPAVIGTPGESFRPYVDASAPAGEPQPTGEPHYGVALASRWPVLSWHTTPLAAAPVRSPVYVPGPTGGLLLLDDEPRALLAAIVRTPDGPLTVATTHLSFVPGWNVRQLRRVVRVLRTLPAPRLLLGDLNLPGVLAGLVSGWRMLAQAPTYPSPRPGVQLDHVLLDPRGGSRMPPVCAVETPAVGVSDHRPLVVEFAPA